MTTKVIKKEPVKPKKLSKILQAAIQFQGGFDKKEVIKFAQADQCVI